MPNYEIDGSAVYRRVIRMRNSEVLTGFTVNFVRHATERSTSLSSTVWNSSKTDLVGASSVATASNKSTATLTANDKNKGYSVMYAEGTFANGDKKRKYFDIHVSDEG